MAILIVSNAVDESDGDFSPGDLSLREAIELANQSRGTDLVRFDASLDGTVLRLTQGQIAITDSIVIDGNLDADGTPDITISGDRLGNDITLAGGITDFDASLASDAARTDGIDNDGDGQADGADPQNNEDLLDDNSRIFEAIDPNVNIGLRGLVLTGGRTHTGSESGGAVVSRGELTVEDSVIAGNSTAGSGSQGGGLYATFLSVSNSEISGNRTAGENALGGGLAGGGVFVEDSTVSDNATGGAGANGGGVSGFGLLVVRDSIVSGNQTTGQNADGGGVAGSLFATVVTGSAVLGNVTTGNDASGGGIYAPTILTLSNSLVQGNATFGGNASGGGIFTQTLNAVSSTIDGNVITGFNKDGGGAFANKAVLTNVTVSGNSASGYGVMGGGLFIRDLLEATHTTITGNSVAQRGLIETAFGVQEQAALAGYTLGAGVGFDSDARGGTFTNSIVLGNGGVFTQGFYGTPIFGPHEIDFEGIASPIGVLTFRGQNIVGSMPMAFDATASNPSIQSGADNVENGDPVAIFAETGPVLADVDLDGVPDFDTFVTGGETRDNGGQVPTAALNPAPNPALDRGGEDQPILIDETFYQTDFNANGLADDVFLRRDELRFDARGPFYSRDIDADQVANSPDLGAFELQRPPDFAISAVDASKPEGDTGPTVYTFEITRSVKPDGPVTVDFAVTGSGPNPAGPDDFLRESFPTGTVSFDDLQTVATLTVEGASDTDGEPDEGFTVTLSNPLGDPLGGTFSVASADGVIQNDDVLPPPSEISIAAITPALDEGTGNNSVFAFLITRTGDDSSAVSVDVDFTGSGANPANGADFPTGLPPTQTVALTEGESQFAVLIEVAGDADPEPDEGFSVTLSNPVGNAVIGTATAEATILDDDTGGGGGGTPPPDARDDLAVTGAGAAATIDALANDESPGGGALDIISVQDPPNGTAAVVAGGIEYTPDAGFEGLDSFTYTVEDPAGGSDTATVSVVVGDLPAAAGSADVQRGSASADLMTPAGPGTYLGLGGEDSYLLSQAVRDGALAIVEDTGPNRIELAEGLAIAEATLLANALSLKLANGAEVRIFGTADDEFAISGNATTGTPGTPVDYATLATDLFGVALPTGNASVTAGPVLIGPAPDAPALFDGEGEGFLLL